MPLPTPGPKWTRLWLSGGNAKDVFEKLWSFQQAHSEAAAAALRRVAVLLVTVNVALKIFGRCATPGSPAAMLLRENRTLP